MPERYFLSIFSTYCSLYVTCMASLISFKEEVLKVDKTLRKLNNKIKEFWLYVALKELRHSRFISYMFALESDDISVLYAVSYFEWKTFLNK